MELTLVEPRGDLHGTSARPLTVFTHIPKCAGTTFENILEGVAKSQGREVRRIRGAIYGQFLGKDKFQHCEQVLRPGALPEIPESVAFLTGHLPYGVHRRIERPSLYVTLLREPASRCRSHFRHGVARGGWTAETPLADLFASGALIDNPQVRQLAGLADPEAPCGEGELRAALEHLEEDYAVVGTQEGFDAFLAVMIALYGWPDVCYGKRRVARDSAPLLEDPESRGVIEARHGCDRELYAEVARRQPLWRKDLLEESAATEVPEGRQVLVSAPFVRFGGRPLAAGKGAGYTLTTREDFRRAFEPLCAEGRIRIVEA